MPEFNSVGDPRRTHPISLALRNQNMEKDQGGSKGYRGRGYSQARKRALYLGRYRSTVTGLGPDRVTLTIDHIMPYRVGGGISSHTNHITNLRITDSTNNRYVDYITGGAENPPKRRLRAY